MCSSLCCCQLSFQLKLMHLLLPQAPPPPSSQGSSSQQSVLLLIHHRVTATSFFYNHHRCLDSRGVFCLNRYRHHYPLLILIQDGVQLPKTLHYSNICNCNKWFNKQVSPDWTNDGMNPTTFDSVNKTVHNHLKSYGTITNTIVKCDSPPLKTNPWQCQINNHPHGLFLDSNVL